jgi:hypothetical protein
MLLAGKAADLDELGLEVVGRGKWPDALIPPARSFDLGHQHSPALSI